MGGQILARPGRLAKPRRLGGLVSSSVSSDARRKARAGPRGSGIRNPSWLSRPPTPSRQKPRSQPTGTRVGARSSDGCDLGLAGVGALVSRVAFERALDQLRLESCTKRAGKRRKRDKDNRSNCRRYDCKTHRYFAHQSLPSLRAQAPNEQTPSSFPPRYFDISRVNTVVWS
jgi:hypothetical protein